MEQVNHPQHYQREGRKECIVEMQEKFGRRMTAIFCLMNSYKYLYRAGLKTKDESTDVKKAKWYFDYVNDHFTNCIRSAGITKLYDELIQIFREFNDD